MFKNYLKITFRNIFRHKAYSFINIAGLAIGMACSIVILLWVINERSYDRFHKNAPNLYRITAQASEFRVAINPAAMPAGLQAEMPVINSWLRFTTQSGHFLEVGEKTFDERKGFYADSNMLELFSFNLLEGDRKTAMNRPDAILLTESLAKKYFGNESALGKTMKRNSKDLVTVTGVLADLPGNSHLQFDYVMPMSAIAKTKQDIVNNAWDNYDFYAYVLLDPAYKADKAGLKKLEAQIDAIYKKHVQDLKVNFTLQPLTDIHLYSNLQMDLPGRGNAEYVTIFLIVAIFIVVVACINFMNLATARSARRAREVGIRKVSGALRGQLVSQFLGESVLIALVALLLAVGLVFIFLPMFNAISEKDLGANLSNINFWLAMLGIAIFTGLLSGSYPALFLSGFRPVKVLKGGLKKMGGSLVFRNGLVVAQFVVSIVLLVGTVVVYNQLHYIRNRDSGFDKESLLYMSMTGDLWGKMDAMRTALKQDPATEKFTITNDVPVNLTSGTINVEWDGKNPNEQIIFPTLEVSESFVDVMKMKVLHGRSFSTDFKSDTANYMLNEKAVLAMGMKPETAVGKQMSLWGQKGTIVGVIKDFNFKPVQRAIEPLIMRLNRWGGYVVVRAPAGGVEKTVSALKRINSELNPAFPLSYQFLDQDMANLYKGEQRLGSLFNIFAVLAIFISCLGLYGLSAFMAEQRTREIGVRKTLGASVSSIVYLLSSGFTRLILLAVVIAVPLSWFAISRWLESYAYHVEVGWGIFAIASVSALLIAWLTVSYESIKAALTNPVKSLRTE